MTSFTEQITKQQSWNALYMYDMVYESDWWV